MRIAQWTSMVLFYGLIVTATSVSAAERLGDGFLGNGFLAMNFAADPTIDDHAFRPLKRASGALDLTGLAVDIDEVVFVLHSPSKDQPKRDRKEQVARNDGKGKKDGDAKSHERRKLHAKMHGIFVELREARENGKEEEAEQLKKQLRELHGQMRKLHPSGHAHGHHRHGKDGRHHGDRAHHGTRDHGPRKGDARSGESKRFDPKKAERVRARFAELRKGIEAAKDAGNEEEVAELKQQARQLAKRVFAHHRAHASANPPSCPACARAKCKPCAAKADKPRCQSAKCSLRDGKKGCPCGKRCPCGKKCKCGKDCKCGKRPGDGKAANRVAKKGPGKAKGPKTPKQRLQHLRIAAVNLEAAGFREHAQKVRLEGKKIAERLRRDAAPRGNDRVMRALLQQVRELSSEVRKLRSRVDELAAKAK